MNRRTAQKPEPSAISATAIFPSAVIVPLVRTQPPSLSPPVGKKERARSGALRTPDLRKGGAVSGYQNTEWRKAAACAEYRDPGDFYDMSPSPRRILVTLQIVCGSCPVFRSCRDYVDEMEGTSGVNLCHGFWAGETAKERVDRRAHQRRRERRARYRARKEARQEEAS